MLTFSDTEEKAVEKAIAALADMIPLEAVQLPHSPALTFPGLEIRLHQRRVLKNGIDVSLTRLLLEGIGEDITREGLIDTPDRIARMCEEIYGGLNQEADHHLLKQFPVENNEIVFSADIRLNTFWMLPD